MLVSNLLIGCGSVGKRHLSKLIELGQKIWVVDPNEDARQFALSQSDLIVDAFPTIESFLKAQGTPSVNLAVIANWGPDHFYAYERIKVLSPHTIIIEKPLTSKLSDLNLMKTHLKESKVSVFVNFHLRFDSGYKKLLELCNATKYGTPVLISIVGGAKCVSTNGIHWIDLSNQLIGSRWDKINASISSKLINPRSIDLNFLEGFTNITYKNNSTLNINFTNDSYMDAQITIVWKKAKGVIVDGVLTIFEAESEIPLDQPVTRSVLFVKKTYETPFSVDGFNNLYAKIDETKGFVMENAIEANELLILSLISSETTSQLRPDKPLPQELVEFDWKIS